MSRLTKAVDGMIERSRKRTTIYGWMGKRLADGEYQFTVDGRPECVWVTMRLSSGAQTTVPAINAAGLPHQPKLSVEMKKEDEDYVILRRSGKKSLSAPQPTDPSGTPPHIHSHLGLEDNDQDVHPQYHNNARGDARYYPRAEDSDEVDPFGDTDRVLAEDSMGDLVWSTWANIKMTLTTLFNALYLKQDGTTPLTGNWDIGEDRVILAESLRARDAEGLILSNDDNTGRITINDDRSISMTRDSNGPLLVIGAYSITEGVNTHISGFSRNVSAEASFNLFRSVAANVLMGTGVDGDTVRRYVFTANGNMEWGPGNADRDSFLFRNGVGQLRLRPRLWVDQNTSGGTALEVTRNLTASSTDAHVVGFTQDHASDDQDLLRLQQDGSGKLITAIASAVEVMSLLASGLLHSLSMTVRPGTASDTARVGGVLYVSTTQAGNVGTGEDPLASYAIPANTLAVNGQSIWFEASGKCASNANAKTTRARFGTSGTNLLIEVAHITTGGVVHWVMKGRVIRTGAATQKGYCVQTQFVEGLTGHGGETTLNLALDQTLSGSVTLQITGEATSNDDITIETFIVGWDGENS